MCNIVQVSAQVLCRPAHLIMFIVVWYPAIFLPHITTCFTILWPLSFFRKGIVVDRLVGFQDLKSKEDFLTRALEHILILKMKGNHVNHTTALYNLGRQMCWQSKKIIGIIDEKKKDDDDDDEESDAKNRRVRSSTAQDTDSDWTWDEDWGLTVFTLWILFVCLFCVVLYCNWFV
jgi:hypothetical protein